VSHALRRTFLIVGFTAALGLGACGPGDSGPGDTIESQEEFLRVCASKGGNGQPIEASGIDISSNNGANFNLRAQKANGITFVYLKASEGNTIQDADYVSFRKQANTLGLLNGPYHFFHPADDGNTQAQNFLKAIEKGLDGGVCGLPPVLDWEVTEGVPWSKAEANAQLWLNAVQKATGQTPMIYTSSAFFPLPVRGDGGLPASFAKYPLWVAQYGPTCPNVNVPWTTWTIFQFGTANNTLDHDYYNGTLAGLQGLDSCTVTDGGRDGGVTDGGATDGGRADGGSGRDGGASDAGGGDAGNPDAGNVACASTSDCLSTFGSCAVCVVPSEICGDLSGPSFCSTDPDEVLGMPCSSGADCGACSSLICASCSSLSSGCSGNCCQFGG